jgi:predicted DCC family thiol-disulfide oxidoreductase YuxK
LCCREIAFYRRRVASVRTRWTDVSACTPEALPEGLTRQDALARFHVQRADGALISGAGAFAELWAHTPGFRWLGFMARLPMIHGVLDRAYGIFLGWRPVLQQLLSRSRET